MMLNHLELYSGIGGMRLGVSRVLPPHVKHACKAVDININANRAYSHNFGEQPVTRSLEYCTAVDLHIKQPAAAAAEAAAAAGGRVPLLWTLSPPCQPYTTTAHSKQADTGDTRFTSFSRILDMLPSLQQLPTHILLENVVNFVNSHSHQRQLRIVLDQLGYQVFDVVLCPSQLGIPHLRPRHYTLAKLHTVRPACSSGRHGSCPFSAAAADQLQQLVHGRPSVATLLALPSRQQPEQQQQQQQHHHHHNQLQPQQLQLRPYLELDWSQQVQPLCKCAPDIQQQVARYALPLSKVSRYYKVLDIVTPGLSAHSNCFTKGYGKTILGAGSYLLEDEAARHLASRDSRGRFHLTHDPYYGTQHSQQQCSSVLGMMAAAREGGVAAGDTAACRYAVQGKCVEATAESLAWGLPGQQHRQQHGRRKQVQQYLQLAASGVLTGRHSHTDAEAYIPPFLRVRSITPREVASLQRFPSWFSFPGDISDRQAYALLGNSLSIDAVSYLARILLEDVISGSFYSH